jgi:hypothetical protein
MQKAFPPDGRAGLLDVDAHDEEELAVVVTL